MSDFGRCPRCGVMFEQVTEDVPVRPGEMLTGVPQGICVACDLRVYKAADIEILEGVMKGRPAPERQIPR